jgi:hypothetical protein
MNTQTTYHLPFPATVLCCLCLLLAGLTSCDNGGASYLLTGTEELVPGEDDYQSPAGELSVCHYDPETNVYERILIREKDWAHHAQHGDVRLDDQDKDGFIAYNHCDAMEGIQVFDCDDLDGKRYPTNAESCDDIDRDCNGDVVNRITRVYDAQGQPFANGFALFGASVGTATAYWANMVTTSCNPADPAQKVNGKIALIDRMVVGSTTPCPDPDNDFFSRQAFRAEQRGAIGVIICNTDPHHPDEPIAMRPGTKDPVTIPVGSLSQQDCAYLRSQAPMELTITTESVCGKPALPKAVTDFPDGGDRPTQYARRGQAYFAQ